MEIEQITAGVDWLSATMSPDDDKLFHLVMTANRALEEMKDEGYEKVERSLLGYDGFACGNCFYGHRDDGTFVQFSGPHADRYYHRIMMWEPRISRLDVQVTVRYKEMPLTEAKDAYRDGVAFSQRLPVHRRRKLFIIIGSDGGDTCYVGSPSSDERSRIYNKEVQSENPEYTRSWRWEVTFKRDRARVAQRTIGPQDDGFRQRCVNLVRTWHITRGIMPPWVDCGSYLLMAPERTLPTDIERKLQWLERQVKPTVDYLREAGYGDRIAVLLGLIPP